MSELNKFILDEQRNKAYERDPGNWHPSAVGGCERKAVLTRSGFPGRDHDDGTLRKFWMGDRIHENLQKAANSTFTVLGHELEVYNKEYSVKGKLDTLIQVEDGVEVLEFKSVHSMAFKYGNMPYLQHIDQLACYMAFRALSEPKRKITRYATQYEAELYPIPKRGRIIYWSKDDAYIQEYTVENTEELQQQTRDRLARLSASLLVYNSSKILPDVLPRVPVLKKDVLTTKLDPQCPRCPYLTFCFGEPNDPRPD